MMTIEELIANPDQIQLVSTGEVNAIVTSIASRQIQLAALSVALVTRQQEAQPEPESSSDDLVDIDEAAIRVSMSVAWLRRNGKKLPFRRKIGGSVRFSKRGIERWLQSRR